MSSQIYRMKHRKELAAKERARYRANTKKIKARVRLYGKKIRAKHAARTLTYYYENKQKVRARGLAYDHTKEIMKNFCELCHSKDRLNMHHPDYTRPLEVLTLCYLCHAMIHRKYPEEYKAGNFCSYKPPQK
jgi:hypothetical protein